MLVSIIFEIRPRVEVRICTTNGNFVRATLLNLIKEVDQELSNGLHEDSRDKPFTVSPIMGFMPPGEDKTHITLFKDKKYWFRITALEDKVSNVLMGLNPDELVIADEEFEVLNVLRKDGEHREARTATFESLYNKWMAKKPVGWVKLKFYSPTTFRVGKKNEPLPLPRLIFNGLINKWNRYSPVSLGEELINLIDEGVIVSGYNDLNTKICEFGKYRQVGFVGECKFTIRIKESIWIKILHLLADFAFFAGVGYKTTMGMGQVKKI